MSDANAPGLPPAGRSGADHLHRREELARLLSHWGMPAREDVESVVRLAEEMLDDVLTRLGNQPSASPEPHARPSADVDPFNALVRQCSVVSARRGPLDGRCISVKDNIAVAGVPMTAGSALLEGYAPISSAAVVERALAAGAEVVAITNMDEMAFSADGSSSVYGPVLNPWRTTHLAGGSSAGAAASLHYPTVDMALGGDQAGSVRVPAAWCGVLGFKPTHGRIPTDGTLGIDPTLDHVGLLTTSVRDSALLMDVLTGQRDRPSGGGWTGTPHLDALTRDAAEQQVIRVGVLQEGLDASLGVTDETTAAMESVVTILARGGLTVQPVSVPAHLQTDGVDLAIQCEGLVRLLRSSFGQDGCSSAPAPALARTLRDGFERHGARVSPQVKLGIALGSFLAEARLGGTYAQAQVERSKFRAGYDAALAQVDVLALPTVPYFAPPHVAGLPPRDAVMHGWAPLTNTSQFNLTGHPAVSVPALSVDGLPFGIMLVGRHGRDDQLLAVASRVEAICARADAWIPIGHTEGRVT